MNSNWEAWPFKLIYAPLVPIWVWYTIRSGSIWFFTSSNPKLTFGGMDGEPKKEMYDLLPVELYPSTFYVLPSDDIENVLQQVKAKNIIFPLIVKPQVGFAGVLFRVLDNEKDLRNYHSLMPVEYMVQQMVLYSMEVSIFYIRYPQQKKGTITGFLHKIPLNVTGNGFNTLEQLIMQHPKAVKRIGELHSRHKDNWHKVIASGEKYVLSHAANHNRGAHFIDLKEHIDDQLAAVFDTISNGINDFFYGRYDILCNSIKDLKAGKNYSILEFNGCGAEPNHIYDTGYSLGAAYIEILKHWKALFDISRSNRRQGIHPWPLMKGIRYQIGSKRHYRTIKEVDRKIG